MGSILYECHFELNSIDITMLIILVPVLISNIKKYSDIKKYGIHEKDYAMKILFMRIFLCSFAVSGIIAVCKLVDMYKKTVVAYRNGDYQIVEGYVENFERMGSDGYPPEKFEINGVKFEYSNHRIVPGYHKAKGDCIIGSGQHLKVGYIYSEGWGNIIVYIEELP